MRPQETLPFPDEKYYFENGELVVRQELLTTPTPEVIVLDDRGITGIIKDAGGVERGIEHSGIGWKGGFHPGDQLLRVETSHEGVTWRWDNDEGATGDARCNGPLTGKYEVQPGDLLIADKVTFNPAFESEATVLVPADAPLPGSVEEVANYKPLAIITNAGKLVVWEYNGNMVRWTVELAVAHELMDNQWDYSVLRKEIGRELSLEGCLQTYRPIKEYLQYFSDKYGQDYFNIQKPHQLVDMTEEQSARWFGRLGIHNPQ